MHSPNTLNSATLSPADRDDLFRSFDSWVCIGTTNSARRYHIPRPSSTEDDPTPLCGRHLADGKEWITKSPACFPPGFVDFCRLCEGALLETIDEH